MKNKTAVLVDKEFPIWVRLIAYLAYLVGVGSLFFGSILISSVLFGFPQTYNFFYEGDSYLLATIENFLLSGSTLADITIVLMGLFFLSLGVLYFFIGNGLRKGRNWARKAQIAVSCMSIFFLFVITIIPGRYESGIGGIIGNVIIISYLLWNKKVKSFFIKT